MSDASKHVDIVRTELEKLARAGQVTYYTDLGEKIGKHPRWPLWKSVLDEISYKKPDITIIVLSAKNGWPSQINYKATRGKPNDEQKRFAQAELVKVFNVYCPGKSVPELPIKRKK